MPLAVEHTLVGVVVAVTNGHIHTREIDIGSQLGVNFCLTAVNQVTKCFQVTSRSNHVSI